MLLILEILCGCCLIHFVFAPVTFNDSCIEHFSKYYGFFFFNVEFFTGKEFQKKRGICSFNALNHNNADKQLITSLLQKSVHHPSRANFVSIIVSRRGS